MRLIKKSFGSLKSRASTAYQLHKENNYQKGLNNLNSRNYAYMKKQIFQEPGIIRTKTKTGSFVQQIDPSLIKQQIKYNQTKSRIASSRRVSTGLKRFSSSFRR